MVTDLQGKLQMLTDPAIHSDPIDLLPDRTNKGEEGFMSFFMK